MDDAVLFVYYKVEAAEHAAMAGRVRQMQARLLARWPGLRCELMQRAGGATGLETWLETYRHEHELPAPVQQAVDAEAQDSGLPMPRHSERFVALR